MTSARASPRASAPTAAPTGRACYRVVAYTEPGSAVEDSAVTAAMTSATAGKRFIRHEGCAHESHSSEPYDGTAQHYRTFCC
jgi:hypothetical protein